MKLHSASIETFTLFGVEAHTVEVQVAVSEGYPLTTIVGLPDASVRESRERIDGAFRALKMSPPPKKTVVNLSPAELRKEGSALDLPIALGILAAHKKIDPVRLRGVAAIGELTLDGRLLPVRGALACALAAAELGDRELLLPAANLGEVLGVPGVQPTPIDTLETLKLWIAGEPIVSAPTSESLSGEPTNVLHRNADLAAIAGQSAAKRALEIAAAGGHNLLLVGPPGTGKTLLAKALAEILPPMTELESLEATLVHSVAGLLKVGQTRVRARPFRAPHRTITPAGLVGGGLSPRPGEASLAHGGVLFLDELPEFRAGVLDLLRQPLEEGELRLVRGGRRATFPCRFTLVGAMNPCPCGFLGSHKPCRCTEAQIKRYRGRVGGPLLDRIDLHVVVPQLRPEEISATVMRTRGETRSERGTESGFESDLEDGADRSAESSAEGSAAVAIRVRRSRDRQLARCLSHDWEARSNAEIDFAKLPEACPVGREGRVLLERAVETMGLSARATHRCLRVARTIADLEGTDVITTSHLAEAIQYRFLERGSAGADSDRSLGPRAGSSGS